MVIVYTKLIAEVRPIVKEQEQGEVTHALVCSEHCDLEAYVVSYDPSHCKYQKKIAEVV